MTNFCLLNIIIHLYYFNFYIFLRYLFDFDAKFVVREFTFAMTPKGQDFVGPFTVKGGVAGTRFADNPDVAKALSRCKAGDKVFIEGIKAVGPDGSTRTLNPIIFSLN